MKTKFLTTKLTAVSLALCLCGTAAEVYGHRGPGSGGTGGAGSGTTAATTTSGSAHSTAATSRTTAGGNAAAATTPGALTPTQPGKPPAAQLPPGGSIPPGGVPSGSPPGYVAPYQPQAPNYPYQSGNAGKQVNIPAGAVPNGVVLPPGVVVPNANVTVPNNSAIVPNNPVIVPKNNLNMPNNSASAGVNNQVVVPNNGVASAAGIVNNNNNNNARNLQNRPFASSSIYLPPWPGRPVYNYPRQYTHQPLNTSPSPTVSSSGQAGAPPGSVIRGSTNGGAIPP